MLDKTSTKSPIADETAFTDAELAVFATARRASADLRRTTFSNWILVGHALLLARKRAAAIGGHVRAQRAAAKTILAEHGLSFAAGNSRLLQIMEKLPAVELWRETLTDVEKARWSSPQSVYNKCGAFDRPIGPQKIKSKPMLVSELFMKRSDDIAQLFHRRDPAKCWALYRSLSALLEGTPKPRSGWSRSREQAAAAGASAAAA
jgi:hypothetical protein